MPLPLRDALRDLALYHTITRGMMTTLGGQVHFEFDWMLFEHDGAVVLGFGAPPWSDVPCRLEDDEVRRILPDVLVIGRCLSTRTYLYEAWVCALAHALFAGEGSAPGTLIIEALFWAWRTDDPPRFAAALVTTYWAKLDEYFLADRHAILRARLLRESMRDLGGPQGSPDEARHR